MSALKYPILFITAVVFMANGLRAQHLQPYLKTGHSAPINQLMFNSQGDLLISRDVTGKSILWNFFAQSELSNFPSLNECIKFSASQYGFKEPVTKNITASIDWNGLLVFKQNQHHYFSLAPEHNSFTSVSINADASLVVHTCGDRYVIVRQVADMSHFSAVHFSQRVVYACFHPVLKNVLAVGLPDGNIEVYDLGTHSTIFSLTRQLLKISRVQPVHNSAFLLSKENTLYTNFTSNTSRLLPAVMQNGEFPGDYVLDTGRTSKLPVFYQYYKYKLYKQQNDTAVLVHRMRGLWCSDKLLLPVRNVISACLFRPAKEKAEVSLHLNSSALYYTANNTIVEQAVNGKKRRYYMPGNNLTMYDANEGYVAGVYEPLNSKQEGPYPAADPAYITVVNKTTKRRIYYYSSSVSSIHLLAGSDTLLLQKKDFFSLYKINAQSQPTSFNGQFISYNGSSGDLFFMANGKIVMYNLASQTKTELSDARYRMPIYVHPIERKDKTTAYYIFYEQGCADLVTGGDKLIASYYFYNNGDFTIFTPDNFFYVSSKTLLSRIIVKDDSGKTFALDQFEKQFHRPDIVLKKLGLFDSAMVAVYARAYETFISNVHVSSAILSEPPTATISNWQDSMLTSDSFAVYKFSFRARGQKLTKANIYVNDVPLFNDQGLDLTNKGISAWDTTISLRLSQGENYIAPVCMQEDNSKSLVNTYFVNAQYAYTPRFYFLGIGASLYEDARRNLMFPDDDIRSVSTVIKQRYGARCIVDTLLNDLAVKSNITAALQRLLNTSVNDVVFVLYSGHGMLDGQRNLFLGTRNIDFAQPALNGFAYHELETTLQKIPARKKVLLIDACNSGDLSKGDSIRATGYETLAQSGKGLQIAFVPNSFEESFYLMQDLFKGFSQGNGTVVISASRGNQYALEGAQWQHGALTYSLLQGLEGNADLDRNGAITITELKNYVSRKVADITNGHQKPTFRKDNLNHDWRIW